MKSGTEPLIKAKLKTLGDLRLSWPLAWCWRNPFLNSMFPPADEVIIPYLGKTVWLKEINKEHCDVIYEIEDSGGLIVLPEWIDFFLADESVPSSGWKATGNGEPWIEHFEDRSLMVHDVMIIHG